MSYRDLKSYQQAERIYDLTVEFVKNYIDQKSRTKDQMEQAARSGKQNIVEGSANPTSEKSELKLLGVARASFEELLHDYEDFLLQRGFSKWEKDDPRALEIRNLYKTNKSYRTYLSNSELAANVAICLIHQANFLLDRQIKVNEGKFIKDGGFSENLSRRRFDERKRRISIFPEW